MSYFQVGRPGAATEYRQSIQRLQETFRNMKADGTLEDSGIGYDDLYGSHFILGIYKDGPKRHPIGHIVIATAIHNAVIAWQNTNPILKNIRTCTVRYGAVTYGTNNGGDGLDLTGASGQVMVEFPSIYMDRWWEGDFEFILFSPVQATTPGGRSLTKPPSYYARGGWERSHIYVSRYYAGMAVKADGTKYALSATGTQPWTGGEIVELSFTNGSQAPSVGISCRRNVGVRERLLLFYVSRFVGWGRRRKSLPKTVDERLNFKQEAERSLSARL
jgi:hypothetical protein